MSVAQPRTLTLTVALELSAYGYPVSWRTHALNRYVWTPRVARKRYFAVHLPERFVRVVRNVCQRLPTFACMSIGTPTAGTGLDSRRPENRTVWPLWKNALLRFSVVFDFTTRTRSYVDWNSPLLRFALYANRIVRPYPAGTVQLMRPSASV